MNIEIANRLVNLRKSNGLSQEALAEKLGISRQAVSKWERAEASPDTDNLLLLAKLYKVSLDELLSSEKDPTTNLETVDSSTIESTNGQDYTLEEARKKRGNKNHHAAQFPIAMIAILVYTAIGIFYNIWHPTWLLFLTIPLYYSLIRYFRQKKDASNT